MSDHTQFVEAVVSPGWLSHIGSSSCTAKKINPILQNIQTSQSECSARDARVYLCKCFTPWTNQEVQFKSCILYSFHLQVEDKVSVLSIHHELRQRAQSMSGPSVRSAFREPHSVPGNQSAVMLQPFAQEINGDASIF